ncbi:unnamed protein product [Natator depressus]
MCLPATRWRELLPVVCPCLLSVPAHIAHAEGARAFSCAAASAQSSLQTPFLVRSQLQNHRCRRPLSPRAVMHQHTQLCKGQRCEQRSFHCLPAGGGALRPWLSITEVRAGADTQSREACSISG